MKKMGASNILISGLNGLGVEIGKLHMLLLVGISSNYFCCGLNPVLPMLLL